MPNERKHLLIWEKLWGQRAHSEPKRDSAMYWTTRSFLTRDGIIGSVSQAAVGNRILRILIIYGILVAGLFYVAIDSYLKERPLAAMLGLLGCYLLVAIFRSRNNTGTPIIERKDIRKVIFKPFKA